LNTISKSMVNSNSVDYSDAVGATSTKRFISLDLIVRVLSLISNVDLSTDPLSEATSFLKGYSFAL